MRTAEISDTQTPKLHDHPGEEGAVWSFPPLSNPPRSAQQLLLSHGELSAAGWHVGWAQIIGPRHNICEDSMAVRFVQQPPESAPGSTGIYAVMADGVGGGARGEVASNALALHCIQFSPESYCTGGMWDDSLRSWLLQSDHVVTQAVRAVASQPGASTLAATWLDPSGQGWISRVGDARAYLVSRVAYQAAADPVQTLDSPKWQARPVLSDQTYAFLGELPPAPDLADEPARMVGAGLIGNPEVVPITVGDDDTLVLCSDGLHRFFDAETLAALSAEEADLDAVASTLVCLARARGSDDDISVLVLRRKVL